jgi:hypothetical protein
VGPRTGLDDVEKKKFFPAKMLYAVLTSLSPLHERFLDIKHMNYLTNSMELGPSSEATSCSVTQ